MIFQCLQFLMMLDECTYVSKLRAYLVFCGAATTICTVHDVHGSARARCPGEVTIYPGVTDRRHVRLKL